MSEVKLRPHHGQCMAFFQGKGYSKEFVVHMQELLQALRKEAEQEIEITMEADSVCECCPNRRGQGCESQEKVLRYDQEVARLCGFYPGQKISYQDFVQQVKENILSVGKLGSVCGDCEWFEICNAR